MADPVEAHGYRIFVHVSADDYSRTMLAHDLTHDTVVSVKVVDIQSYYETNKISTLCFARF